MRSSDPSEGLAFPGLKRIMVIISVPVLAGKQEKLSGKAARDFVQDVLSPAPRPASEPRGFSPNPINHRVDGD